MGNNVCPCLSHTDYTTIPDETNELLLDPLSPPRSSPAPLAVVSPSRSPKTPPRSVTADTIAIPGSPAPLGESIFHPIPDVNKGDSLYDKDSPVFKGMVVEQKFFSKSTYDPKYVWVNLKSRTLCLSEHNTRDRSHKEASLADVTGVIAGPPERYKAPLGPDGSAVKPNYELCLSVKFVRGGGIDLKFQSAADRDVWYNMMVRIIAQQQDLESAHSGSGSSASGASGGISSGGGLGGGHA